LRAMSKVALVYDRLTPDEVEILIAAEEQGVGIVPLFVKDPTRVFLRDEDAAAFNVAINRCESKGRALRVSAVLESQYGKRVVNPSRVEALCASKLETLNLWVKHGVDVPKWVYIPFASKEKETGWEKNVADKVEGGLSFPLVLKPTQGSWGKGVVKVGSRKAFLKAVHEAQPSSINPDGVFAQEYITKPGFDLRILCFKKPYQEPRYLCCIARVTRTKAEFRTNTHLGGLPVGIDIPLFPGIMAEALRAAGLLLDPSDAAIVALDAMPVLEGEDEADAVYRLVRRCVRRFDAVRAFVRENEARRYLRWKPTLEQLFSEYRASACYLSLKEKIEEVLQVSWVKWHEVNSRFDYAVNTRNATQVNPAHTYVELCRELI